MDVVLMSASDEPPRAASDDTDAELVDEPSSLPALKTLLDGLIACSEPLLLERRSLRLPVVVE
jgi:hypothetical protein